MYYIGADLGTQSSYYVVQDNCGHTLKKTKIRNEECAIEETLKPFKPGRVVIEATGNSYWMHTTLTRMGYEVVIAHPLKTRAIADARIKNDKLDATTLAHLLRADLIPESYMPSEEIRGLRELTRQHIRLTQIRTRIKNQGHALLTKLNYQPTHRLSDVYGTKGRAWLKDLKLPYPFDIQMKQVLEQVEFYNHMIHQVNWQIEKRLREFPETDKLREIPGIGLFSAALIWAEIGNIHRFPTPKKLVGYAGMAPGLYASGQTYHTRPITHQGSKFLRWILCESAQHHIMKPGPLRNFYLRLKEKKGHGKALMATARKLLTQVYYTLKSENIYQFE